MFLTRKALRKMRFLTITLFILGAIYFIFSGVFTYLHIENKLLITLGVICWSYGILYRIVGKYGEGKGKLINNGQKLVFRELRPAEFIRLYEETKDCPDNVIANPDFDVLQLLATAYDALGENEIALEVLEQMHKIAPEKKKTLVKLLKSGALFELGRVEEGDVLYNQALGESLDLSTRSVFIALTKSDRAKALGDYATAETYYKQILAKRFPQITPLVAVVCHYNLAQIYVKTQQNEKAKMHYHYCIRNGGETGMKFAAIRMFETL